jgi:peroxiredoxin
MSSTARGNKKTWMHATLAAAGLYSLLWAGSILTNPLDLFQRLGVEAPNHVGLWQALGYGVGVLGVGYLIAASDPLRHWPLVLLGLLSKLGGAFGLGTAIRGGHMPAEALWLVVVNDLIWCGPFAVILWLAYQASLRQRRVLSPEIVRMAMRRRTNQGVTLDEMSALSPVLLVFLRHAGCTFCREALADLASRRAEIEKNGARLTLVHMGSEERGAKFFARYGLQDVPRVSDPERALYRAFGLPRGSLGDLFGPKVWWRGFQAGILGRHGVGLLEGDGFQMPGVFLLFHGEVLRSYRHQSAADRPDYLALVTGKEYAAPEFSA